MENYFGFMYSVVSESYARLLIFKESQWVKPSAGEQEEKIMLLLYLFLFLI